MKSAAVFIHSRYPKSQLNFYKNLCLGKYKVAVDGGYNFFKQAKIKPDIVIGDFDSVRKDSIKGINALVFPRRKDATDTELAIAYCIEKKFSTIDIVMPTAGEPDHFLGLVSLLLVPELGWRKNFQVAARIVNHECEIMLLTNREMSFPDSKDEMISILPYGDSIKLTCMGMDYPAEGLIIRPWQTKGMRNIIRSKAAKIIVKGTAVIVHYWNKNS
ncbi:MAG TPA: thiamine diphosphokinase [candidate division Zixibacteria bacterium]|nr:thiamine diphosphokinase [candidate division Zixibacteria bacterium]